MHLVRTTGIIDELLVRATEKALSSRLLQDYKKAARVESFTPVLLSTRAMEGLLSGGYMVDDHGHPIEECVTDSDDEEYWEAKVSDARKWWLAQKAYFMVLDELSLSEIQELLDLPSKHAARRESQDISTHLLLATVVVESIDIAAHLLRTNWLPEESCLALRSDVVDWLVGKLDLPQDVATEAKRGEFHLGLSRSEHYSLVLGLYSGEKNTTRVRSELRHPDPMAAIILRRTTIVHEAVHAVAVVQVGYKNLDVVKDRRVFEGIAELCTLHYLKERFEQYEDWLWLPHSETYAATTPPEYVEDCLRMKSICDLTGDYRILSALLRMKPDSIQDDSICVTDIICRIEHLVQVLGHELASDLVQRVLESLPMEEVASALYAVGDENKQDLLDLLRKFDEAWSGLVE